MRPGRYDIKINRGGSYSVSFTAQVNGTPINFATTYTGARLQVRPAWVASQADIVGDPLFEISTITGGLAFSTYTLLMALSAEVTRTLLFNEGSYSLELFNTTGVEKVDPFLYGDFLVDFERTV